MKSLLRVDSSLFSEQGVSSSLMDELVAKLQTQSNIKNVKKRDLVNDAIPHIDAEWIQALSLKPNQRSEQQQAKVDYSDRLIEEVEHADILVLALPMYNFSVPSVVKAWFDHLARAGRTFAYTSDGPKGLLTGKTVYLVTTRGGVHKDKASDTQIPFVLNFLNFIGLTQIEVIYAEGLNLGGESREQGIAEARKNINSLVAA